MNDETNRLNTFVNWPNTAPVEAISVAKAGFYRTGQGLEVQCFSCGSKISDWNYGDVAMSRHRQLDPNCPFIVNAVASGNQPLELQPWTTLEEAITNDSNGALEDAVQPVQDYGLMEDDEMYKSDALRLLSFVNWDDSSVSRESLVSAGFYHAGEGRLRCAWCGGELARTRRLASLGSPLEIHRRYFPGCQHAAILAARDAASLSNHQSPAVDSPLNSPPAAASPPHSTTAVTPPLRSPQPTDDSTELQSSASVHNSLVLSGGATWRALGVVAGAGGARHAGRADRAARLASFTAWPARTQTPDLMADAGFFYTGHDDQVICFYCGGGLAKWEPGDQPWTEHARWFPHCGFVLLVKGREFVDSCRPTNTVTRTVSADSRLGPRIANTENRPRFPVTEAQVNAAMENGPALAALGAGLDAARVRRALRRRLQHTGVTFTSAEALIDAVLDGQLGEESWSVPQLPQLSQSQHFARDILAQSVIGVLNDNVIARGEHRSESVLSDASRRSASPSSLPSAPPAPTEERIPAPAPKAPSPQPALPSEPRTISSLEEENRQLKEARLCKVCMDSEVCVVFLPCGHLVSCGACGGGLARCPLCRARVQALVRAYLA